MKNVILAVLTILTTTAMFGQQIRIESIERVEKSESAKSHKATPTPYNTRMRSSETEVVFEGDNDEKITRPRYDLVKPQVKDVKVVPQGDGESIRFTVKNEATAKQSITQVMIHFNPFSMLTFSNHKNRPGWHASGHAWFVTTASLGIAPGKEETFSVDVDKSLPELKIAFSGIDLEAEVNRMADDTSSEDLKRFAASKAAVLDTVVVKIQ